MEQIEIHHQSLGELSTTKQLMSLLGLLYIGGRYFTNSNQDTTYNTLVECAANTIQFVANGLDRDSVSSVQEAFEEIPVEWQE